MTGTGYQLTKAIGRVVGHNTIMLNPVVGGGATLSVWAGTERVDGWVASYRKVDDAIAEARRVRAAIETYGSINAVERAAARYTAELITCRDAARIAWLSDELDRIESLSLKAAAQQLGAETADYLAATAV